MTIHKGDAVKHERFNGIALRVSAVFPRSQEARVYMVGDDQYYRLPLDELAPLDEDQYCGGCGQIGCSWG